MNSPQEDVFLPSPTSWRAFETRDGQPLLRVMFHGTLLKRCGLECALEALAILRKQSVPVVLDVYGDGDFREPFLNLVKEMDLQKVVYYHGQKRLEEISKAIEAANVGLISNQRNCFTEINFPTRIFEYLAKGRPLVAPRTPGVMDYFDVESLVTFDPGDAEELAAKLKLMLEEPDRIDRIMEKSLKVLEARSWKNEKAHMVQVVSDLLENRKKKSHQTGATK